jgi:hypothetical protein
MVSSLLRVLRITVSRAQLLGSLPMFAAIRRGNPYGKVIAELMNHGVQIELATAAPEAMSAFKGVKRT